MVERIEEWWCPAPWRVSVIEQDHRPGGALRMTMHGPDGETIPQDGLYLAFEPGVRFVTTDAITSTLHPAGPFMIGVWEIAPEAEGTRYTASARHWRAEDRDAHEAMGFTPGWTAAAEQLAKLCEG
ncbi:SRPBCC domain-containing protein [Novosphingobium sp. 9]|uniref:SRPBCC domain-containing protein n=1 Tax=Novosphingobium sp. 9 TaxID=2025349 RepID=UPI0021B5F9DA|nr:SRPBCC domain-containing protein [Novosphingobium sp. 9]